METVKTVLEFLKSNAVVIISAIAIFVIFGRSCNIQSNLKGSIKERDERISELLDKNRDLIINVDGLKDSVKFSESVIHQKNQEISELEIEKGEIIERSKVEIARIKKLSPTQADSLLSVKYSNVPDRVKSRAILKDLAECEATAALMSQERTKVDLLESKTVEMQSIINNQAEIIRNLVTMNDNLQSVVEEKDLIIKDYKKHVRQIKWQRNGAYIGVGVITVIVIATAI